MPARLVRGAAGLLPSPRMAGASAPVFAIIEGLQEAQARCADASLEACCPWHHGATQGQVAQASAALVQVPVVPDIPRAAGPLLRRPGSGRIPQQETLEQALGRGHVHRVSALADA